MIAHWERYGEGFKALMQDRTNAKATLELI
jgi:hypothetical protein